MGEFSHNRAHGRRCRATISSLAALLCVAVTIAGCGSDDAGDGTGATAASSEAAPASDSSGGGGSGRPLTIRLNESVDDLDPHTTISSAGLVLSSYAYDTLLGRDADNNLVPRLASKWEVTPTSVTLTIRDDVTCSDGSKLTPSVVAANFERLEDPNVEVPYVTTFLGSSDYTVAADDAAGTVTLTLAQPFGDLAFNLSSYPRIVCQKGLDDPSLLQKESSGTGPFVLESVVPGDSFAFAARDGYVWGPNGSTTAEGGFPSKVTLRVVDNDTTAANLLLSGDLDLGLVAGPERSRLEDSDLPAKVDQPTGVILLWLNETAERPGADPIVREALMQAVSRQDMTTASVGEFGKPAISVAQPGTPCYDEASPEPLPADADLDGAKQLLLANGWTEQDGKLVKDGKQLTIKLIAAGTAGGEYLLEIWQELGASVQLLDQDEETAGEALFGSGDWDAAIFTFNNVTSPSKYRPLVSGPFPPDGSNLAHIENAEYDAAADQAAEQVLPDSCEVWHTADAALFANYDFEPLSYTSSGWYGSDVSFVSLGTTVDPATLRTT